jgi:hypothetical protein
MPERSVDLRDTLSQGQIFANITWVLTIAVCIRETSPPSLTGKKVVEIARMQLIPQSAVTTYNVRVYEEVSLP